jgi:hypothetical protein
VPVRDAGAPAWEDRLGGGLAGPFSARYRHVDGSPWTRWLMVLDELTAA